MCEGCFVPCGTYSCVGRIRVWDVLCHVGRFVSCGTFCVMWDILCHVGRFVSCGTFCVMWDEFVCGTFCAMWNVFVCGTFCAMWDVFVCGTYSFHVGRFFRGYFSLEAFNSWMFRRYSTLCWWQISPPKLIFIETTVGVYILYKFINIPTALGKLSPY